jgi:hypothetical protein
VTADNNCLPRLTLVSSVQITARLDININKFFDNDGITKFIDRVCAFLNINDTSRLKVVGVKEGSTILYAYLSP